MLYPIRTLILAIGVIIVRISQAFGSGCLIEIKLPLAVVGLPSQDFTRNFKIGTTLKFNCTSRDQITYILTGAPKVICQKDNTWFPKIPKCKATFCSPTPPIVPNAQLLTYIQPGINNKVGAFVKYKCLKGYSSPPEHLKIVCQKDGYWQNIVSCKRITCSALNLWKGQVSYTSLVSGGKATFTCDSGYSLIGPTVRTCGDNGFWSGNVSRCSKMCSQLPDPLNGYFDPVRPIYSARAIVTLKCMDRYVVRGSKTRMCQDNGEWTHVPSKCVINSCGPPGSFPHGRMVEDISGYVIGATVKFECFSGYKLRGPTSRQCLDKGVWSEHKNPICVKVYCSEPGHITHGYHKPTQSQYLYGEKVPYYCYPHYYIWPSESRVLECMAYNFTPYWSSKPPECITLAQYNTNCKRINGYFHIKNGQPDCTIDKATTSTNYNSEGKSHSHSMDTLTIVTASAGSTLGVLVIILSIMVFVRRFHRNRRFRSHAIRSRFYSDDDHVTLIACPRGFHFALPSYDEAMSQVQRDPPPFESVVQVNSTTVINNNATVTPSVSDPSGNDRTVLEVSVGQQVNIVSNPLTENQQQNRPASNTASNPGENSNRNSISSQDSLVISEVQSSHDGITLSLSEDEQSVNEAQPLIGSN